MPDTPSANPGPTSSGAGLDRALLAVASVVVLGAIMSILDTTVVNVAINDLSKEFGADLATIQWVVTGYTLALATVIPLTGWASERFGTKRLYMISMTLFLIGSAAAGAAWSAESLILFRVLQGLGGGMILPAGMTILTQAAGPQRVGRVMSIVGVPMLLGPILGPILGGWLVDDVSWRWIFYINIPIGLIAVPLAFKILARDEPQPAQKLDLLGLAMLSPGLALLIYGLAQTGSHDLGSGGVLIPALTGAVLIAGFVRHALRVPSPLIDLRLFRSRAVGAAAATMTLFSLAFFGAMLLLPLYFQTVRGESALDTGLLLAPQGLGAMLTMPVAGILTDRTGAGRLVLTGVVVITATIAVLTQITDTTSYLVLGVTLFVMGIGLGMTMMPTMSSAMQALRRAEVPKGTTALNIIQQVGGSIGTATLSLLLAHALVSRLPGAGEGEGLAAAQQIPPESRAQLLPVVADAFGSTFVWAAILVAVAFIPALLLPRRPPSALPRDPGDELDEPAPQFLHV